MRHSPFLQTGSSRETPSRPAQIPMAQIAVSQSLIHFDPPAYLYIQAAGTTVV